MKYSLLVLMLAAVVLYSFGSPVLGSFHAKRTPPAAAAPAEPPPTQGEQVCIAASEAACMEGLKDKCDSVQGPFKSECKKKFQEQCENVANEICRK